MSDSGSVPAARPSAGRAGGPRWWTDRRVLLVVVCTAAGLVYAHALGNGFAYDDVPLIPGDPRLRSLDPGELLGAPFWPGAGRELGLWRPAVTLSFAADWWLSDGSAWWFHAVNVLLHVAVSALVFLLLERLVPRIGAGAGALIFAVHPVHVEAVANVAGRSELLAALFGLGTFLVWRRAKRSPAIGRIVVAATLLGFALLSKEHAVVLLPLLVLGDGASGLWRANRRSFLRYARERGPGLLVLAAVCAAWSVARVQVVGSVGPTVVNPVSEVARGPGGRLLSALQVWPAYLRLLFFPVTLLADYGPRVFLPLDGWTPAAASGLLLVLALPAAGLAALSRGRQRLGLALLWFPVAILPVSNLVLPVGILLAERTLYLPSIALALGVGLGVTAAMKRWRSGIGAAGAVALIGVSGTALVLAARTVNRVPAWDSTESIFRTQLDDRPDSYRAHWYFARDASERGAAAEATREYARALDLWPHRRRLVLEATAFEASRGRVEVARELAGYATDRWPGSVEAQRLLAATALDLADTLTAREAIDAGLQMDGDDPLLLRMRGAVESTSGNASGTEKR